MKSEYKWVDNEEQENSTIQKLREQYSALENDVRKSLEAWIRNNEEQEKIRKSKNEIPTTFSQSSSAPSYDVSASSLDGNDSYVPAPQENTEDKQLEITGELEEPKNPREQVTIAVSCKDGFEIKTLSADELEDIEDHVVLVDWSEVIMEHPTIDDVDTILSDAHQQFNNNLKENHAFLIEGANKIEGIPNINNFGKKEIEESPEEESLVDMAEREAQEKTEEPEDINEEVEESLEEEISSLSEMLDIGEEAEESLEEDLSLADMIEGEFNSTNVVDAEIENIEDNVPSIEEMSNNEENEIPLVEGQVVEESSIRNDYMMRENGVIFVGRDVDIVNEPQIVADIANMSMMKILKDQVINEMHKRESIRESTQETTLIAEHINEEEPEPDEEEPSQPSM